MSPTPLSALCKPHGLRGREEKEAFLCIRFFDFGCRGFCHCRCCKRGGPPLGPGLVPKPLSLGHVQRRPIPVVVAVLGARCCCCCCCYCVLACQRVFRRGCCDLWLKKLRRAKCHNLILCIGAAPKERKPLVHDRSRSCLLICYRL